VFPEPPAGVPEPIPPPPPPEPPFPPAKTSLAPFPPPVAIIVEKIELDPAVPQAIGGEAAPPAPPAPTVIGKAVAVTVILFGALG
jgi:Wiskott-Aldrich syndrome protein